jgi:hypothetical protein
MAAGKEGYPQIVHRRCSTGRPWACRSVKEATLNGPSLLCTTTEEKSLLDGNMRRNHYLEMSGALSSSLEAKMRPGKVIFLVIKTKRMNFVVYFVTNLMFLRELTVMRSEEKIDHTSKQSPTDPIMHYPFGVLGEQLCTTVRFWTFLEAQRERGTG